MRGNQEDDRKLQPVENTSAPTLQPIRGLPQLQPQMRPFIAWPISAHGLVALVLVTTYNVELAVNCCSTHAFPNRAIGILDINT